ncbi:MAG: hypothetical protein NUK65_06425, partial [Firmicutes bacterium]|nr:hypothetical protein [Bacillota bacterium]
PYQTTQNQDAVLFSLNHQAKDAFKQETAERQGETTKIYLDDELMSTFTINAQINDGKFLLAGKRPVADAHMFSVLIEHPLPLQVDVFSQETENE